MDVATLSSPNEVTHHYQCASRLGMNLSKFVQYQHPLNLQRWHCCSLNHVVGLRRHQLPCYVQSAALTEPVHLQRKVEAGARWMFAVLVQASVETMKWVGHGMLQAVQAVHWELAKESEDLKVLLSQNDRLKELF